MFGRSNCQDGEHHPLSRTELFVAASKNFPISPEGVFRAFKVHGGFRQFWPDEGGSNSLVYVGGEIVFPWDVSFLAEVSTKDNLPFTPYAFGVQWRPTGVVGLSAAVQDDGIIGRLSFYFGIAATFQF